MGTEAIYTDGNIVGTYIRNAEFLYRYPQEKSGSYCLSL